MLQMLARVFGPMYFKEMADMARRPRYYVNRVLFCLALLVGLFIAYEEYRTSLMWRSPINAGAEMANNLFLAACWIQYAAVFLFVPLFVSGVVAGEREERTLELLFTTHLTDREIVLGKLASRLTALFVLIFGGLPVISLIMLFGGVAPEAVLRALLATLLAAVFVGACAIYFSATTKSPLGALIRTYWWLAFWLIGVSAVIVFLVGEFDWPWRREEEALCFLAMFNPLGPFVAAVLDEAYRDMARFWGRWFFPFFFIAPSLLSVFLIWRAVRRLRHEPTRRLRWLRRPKVLSRLWESSIFSGLRTLCEDWQAFRQQRRIGRDEQVANPLWQRARVARVYDREGYIGKIQWLACLAAGFFVIFMAIIEPNDFDDEEMSMAFLAPTWLAIVALVGVFAGTSFVGDRRRGFLELVLVTPLTGRDIIDGTALAVWQHVRRLYWLPFALGFIFICTGASLPHGVLFSIITATLFCGVLLMQGLACSLAAKSMPAALVTTFLLPLVANIGTLLLMGLFRGDSGPASWIILTLLLAATYAWLRIHKSLAAVASFLTAVHLAICASAVCWTYTGNTRDSEFPLAAMHPGYLTLMVLDNNSDRWFDRKASWWVLPCYWGALLVNILWARWWLIRRFDALAERMGRGTHRVGRELDAQRRGRLQKPQGSPPVARTA